MSKRAALLFLAVASLLAGCEQPAREDNISLLSFNFDEPQMEATNVQDWDRIAIQIADGLEQQHLLPPPPGPGQPAQTSQVYQPLYVQTRQNSLFLIQLADALRAEIVKRNGTLASYSSGAKIINLHSDVIVWGSRLKSDPNRVRTEIVWTASFPGSSGFPVVLAKPFYAFASDLHLYIDKSQGSDLYPRTLHYAQY